MFSFIGRPNRVTSTRPLNNEPAPAEQSSLPVPTLTRSMAGLSVRNRTGQAPEAGAMPPRVRFNPEARARRIGEEESLVTAVHFERTGHPQRARQPHAAAGALRPPAGAAHPEGAAQAPRSHLSTAQTFDERVQRFMDSDAPFPIKQRLAHQMQARGRRGFDDGANEAYGALEGHTRARELLMAVVRAYGRMSTEEQNGSSSVPAREAPSNSRAAGTHHRANQQPAPAQSFRQLMKQFMNSQVHQSIKDQLATALNQRGVEGFLLESGNALNRISPDQDHAGRLLRDATRALRKVPEEERAHIRPLASRPRPS